MTLALAEDWSGGMGDPPNVTKSTKQLINEETDLSNLPQWKRDYLMKKRALLVHQQEQKIKQANYTNSDSLSNGRYDCVSLSVSKDKQNNGHPFHTGPVKMVGISSTASGTGMEMVSEDSDDSSVGTEVQKSGGYSFITGERIAVDDPSEESSLSADEDPRSSESASDTGSVDLKYQPGYVSKLLNKWTNISYNKQDANTTKSISRPMYLRPLDNTSNPASKRAVVHDSRKDLTAKGPENGVAVTGRSRAPSYRDPVEIVLIENGSTSRQEEEVDEEEDSLMGESISSATSSTITVTNKVEVIPSTSDTSNSLISTKQTSGSSEWDKDLSIHEKVQLARAVFELDGTSPTAPPRRRRGLNQRLSSPTAVSPTSSPVVLSPREESTATDSRSNLTNAGSSSNHREDKVNGLLTPTPSPVTSTEPSPIHAVNSKVKLQNRSKTSPSHGKGEAPQPPFFTSVKLKPTKHNLYDVSSEPESTGQLNPPTSPTSQLFHSKPKSSQSDYSKSVNSQSQKSSLDSSQTSRCVETHTSQSHREISGIGQSDPSFMSKPSSTSQTDSRKLHSVSPSPKSDNVTDEDVLVVEYSVIPLTKRRESDSMNKCGNSEPSTYPPKTESSTPSRLTNHSERTAQLTNKSQIDTFTKQEPSAKPSRLATSTSKPPSAVKLSDIPNKVPKVSEKKAERVNVTNINNANSNSVSSDNSKGSKPSHSQTEVSPPALTKPVSPSQSRTVTPLTRTSMEKVENTTDISPVRNTSPSVAKSNKSKTDSSSKPDSVSSPVLNQASLKDIPPPNKTTAPRPVSPKSTKTVTPANRSQLVSSNKTVSLSDIPSPGSPKQQAKVKTSSSPEETDLMALLKKRRENEVPVTNIDDIIGSKRSSGSSVVFDTRKSMGNNRKVPEYEKIHTGPVVDYTGGQVLAGGCLKPSNSSSSIRKNLSFNDVNLASVHEYPSEKVMIQNQPKEQGAVYWDDPDHLQAAPSRSQDDPDDSELPQSFKSVKRSGIAGGTPRIGISGSHHSSLTENYQFGQGVSSPPSTNTSNIERESGDNSTAYSSDFLQINPTSEHDALSFSSASADLLF